MQNCKRAHELKIPNLFFEPNKQLIPKMFNSYVIYIYIYIYIYISYHELTYTLYELYFI
jgi:hypothetical protein